MRKYKPSVDKIEEYEKWHEYSKQLALAMRNTAKRVWIECGGKPNEFKTCMFPAKKKTMICPRFIGPICFYFPCLREKNEKS